VRRVGAHRRRRPNAGALRPAPVRSSIAVALGSKANGLATVAGALNKGEVALAQIAALLLQFPDPHSTLESGGNEARTRLAKELFWSGLLKADPEWDVKHPRTGTPLNPGWFAEMPKDAREPKASRMSGAGWPSKDVNFAVRAMALELALELAELEPHVREGVLLFELAREAITELRDEGDTSGRRTRDFTSAQSFSEQREVGLQALRKMGVLE
jgi:hypothetical protein